MCHVFGHFSFRDVGQITVWSRKGVSVSTVIKVYIERSLQHTSISHTYTDINCVATIRHVKMWNEKVKCHTTSHEVQVRTFRRSEQNNIYRRSTNSKSLGHLKEKRNP